MSGVAQPVSTAERFGSAADHLDRAVCWASAVILGGTFVVLFVSIFLNVILRYVFSEGFLWAYELPQVLFPWLTVSGAVLAAQASRHIGVEALMQVLPQKGKKLLVLVVQVIVFVTCFEVGRFAVPMAIEASTSHLSITGLSEGWGYSSLVFGYFMMALTAVTTFYRIYIADRVVTQMESETNILDKFGTSKEQGAQTEVGG